MKQLTRNDLKSIKGGDGGGVTCASCGSNNTLCVFTHADWDCNGLENSGVTCFTPDGTFHYYPC